METHGHLFFSADSVDSVLQQYEEWYDFPGPIETGKRMLTGLPRNGEVNTLLTCLIEHY